MTTVLVTGGRGWTDQATIDATLDQLAWKYGDITIIEGGQVTRDGDRRWGADYFAACWADRHGAEHRQYRAEWRRYKKGAGPKRNQRMLDEESIDVVVAFHENLAESSGTADMVNRARAAGIPVVLVESAIFDVRGGET
jgi:hypothetical protein